MGRPNVGKSSLFNRLCKKSIAIVHKTAGVTRDCRQQEVDFYGCCFTLMDTPGLLDAYSDPDLFKTIEQHTYASLKAADVIFFMIDGKDGLSNVDRELAHIVKQHAKRIIVLVNKVEKDIDLWSVGETYSLGFTDVFPISAQDGNGLSDLFIFLRNEYPCVLEEEDKERDTNVVLQGVTTPQKKDYDAFLYPYQNTPKEAEKVEDVRDEQMESTHYKLVGDLTFSIVGRPNVGKSTLFNTFLGANIQLVHDFPGVTRDSVLRPFHYKGRSFRLVDTAGLRRKDQKADILEKISIQKTHDTIQKSHIVLMMIDATTIDDFMDKQDMTLIHMILEAKKAIVILLNKMDLVEHKKRPLILETIKHILSHEFVGFKNAPVLLTSAKRHTCVAKIMEQVLQTEERYLKRFKTSQLNAWLKTAIEHHRISDVKVKYIHQIKSAPPVFFLQGNKTYDVPKSYTRYLVNSFIDYFHMGGVPITFLYKNAKNPYDSNNRTSK